MNLSAGNLDISYENLDIDGILEKIKALSTEELKSVDTLNLSGNMIDDDGIKQLLAYIKEMEVKNIYLDNNIFGVRGASLLLSCPFVVLSMGANDMSSHFLSDVLINKSIKVLGLYECGLNDADINHLFSTSNDVAEIDIGTNSIDGSCLSKLCENSELKKLKIIQNDITVDSLKDIISKISELDADSCFLGDEIVNLVLTKGNSLDSISLYQCNITDDGAGELAKSKIASIELRGNPCDVQKFFNDRIQYVFGDDACNLIKKSHVARFLLTDIEFFKIFYELHNSGELLEFIKRLQHEIFSTSSGEGVNFSIQEKVNYLMRNTCLVNLLKEESNVFDSLLNCFPRKMSGKHDGIPLAGDDPVETTSSRIKNNLR
jgi:hypothetical protein